MVIVVIIILILTCQSYISQLLQNVYQSVTSLLKRLATLNTIHKQLCNEIGSVSFEWVDRWDGIGNLQVG